MCVCVSHARDAWASHCAGDGMGTVMEWDRDADDVGTEMINDWN